MIYWLDNGLVVLTAQLYRPGAVDEGIARIVFYCQKHCSTQFVDAVLISVEHVVLVHVVPGEKVQHTAMMPLLDRYRKPYLERLGAQEEKIEKKTVERLRKIERRFRVEVVGLSHGMNSDEEVESDEEDESAFYTIQVNCNISSTFYALVHLFEAAACKAMPLATATAGRFPNEIYNQIIMQTTDVETRKSLMEVSGTFRRICQEDLLFTEGLIIKPSVACQSCDEATRLPKWFESYDTGTRAQSRADALIHDLQRRSAINLQRHRFDSSWQVAIGTERNKKSLLAAVAIAFQNI